MTEVGEHALTALAGLLSNLREVIEADSSDDGLGARPPLGWARAVVTRQEALLNPASRSLTARLYTQGSLAEHVEAVRTHVGEPVFVPVVVLATTAGFERSALTVETAAARISVTWQSSSVAVSGNRPQPSESRAGSAIRWYTN